MNQEKLAPYRDDKTREVELPDGSKRAVHMPRLLWDNLEFLLLLEGITATQIATYALEEMSLQAISFDNAFGAVVVHLASRWT